MSHDVVTVPDTSTIGSAVDRVLRRGHTHVVVVDGAGNLLDIVSAHLLTTALMTRLVDRHQPIESILADPAIIDADAALAEAAALMMARSVDALGVVDPGGLVVGVLTWSDIGRCAVAPAVVPPPQPTS
jgi:CBS domain-containing protein